MSDFIPGVFSYCDQWCARCPLAERCAVFAGSAVLGALDLDPANPDYWKTMMEQFYDAHPEFPRDAIDAIEVRQPTEDELALYQRQQEETMQYLHAQPLSAQAAALYELLYDYAGDVDYWRIRARRFAEEASMGIRTVAECFADCDRVTEQEHQLRWYAGVMAERVKMALLSLRDEPGAAGLAQTEANGSAKVALLALEKILQALRAYLGLTGDEDRLLPLLSATTQLTRSVTHCFPLAMKFRRPGFDELPVAEAHVLHPGR